MRERWGEETYLCVRESETVTIENCNTIVTHLYICVMHMCVCYTSHITRNLCTAERDQYIAERDQTIRTT